MRFGWLAGLVLLVMLVVPATASAGNPYEKIVVINLAYDNGVVKESSADIQYGTAPNLNIQSDGIEGLLLDARKKTINEFSIRDPRVQTGDSVTTGPDGTPQGLVGSSQDNPTVDFGIVVPFTPDLQYVTLVDPPSGNTLVSVDLTGPVSAFREMYPDDPDIRSIPQAAPARPFPVPVEIIAIFGILLISISGLGYLSNSRVVRPKEVLIVDDEPAILEIFSLLLAQKGYIPVTAESGEACLSILKNRKTRPDLILLDIMMYPMDGWQTLEKIKENAGWKEIPVLMVTGKQPTPAELRKYGLCIEDYLLKPIQAHELYGAIEYMFHRKKEIAGEVHVALKAGYEKDLVCEYARLRRRVEVEKKLIDIVRAAYSAGASMHDGVTTTLEDVVLEIGSREERLRILQTQLGSALAPRPVPVDS